MGSNSLYGREFLIWEEIPFMGGNSLYGSGECHLQHLGTRCSMACGVVFGGAMQLLMCRCVCPSADSRSVGLA